MFMDDADMMSRAIEYVSGLMTRARGRPRKSSRNVSDAVPLVDVRKHYVTCGYDIESTAEACRLHRSVVEHIVNDIDVARSKIR